MTGQPYAGPIVDTHVHYWDPTRHYYPRLTDKPAKGTYRSNTRGGLPFGVLMTRADLAAAVYQRSKRVTTKPVLSPAVNLASARPKTRMGRSRELGLMTRGGEPPDPLPFAEEEAKKVASLYNTVAHTGIEPTEAWFRQRAPQAKTFVRRQSALLHENRNLSVLRPDGAILIIG